MLNIHDIMVANGMWLKALKPLGYAPIEFDYREAYYKDLDKNIQIWLYIEYDRLVVNFIVSSGNKSYFEAIKDFDLHNPNYLDKMLEFIRQLELHYKRTQFTPYPTRWDNDEAEGIAAQNISELKSFSEQSDLYITNIEGRVFGRR